MIMKKHIDQRSRIVMWNERKTFFTLHSSINGYSWANTHTHTHIQEDWGKRKIGAYQGRDKLVKSHRQACQPRGVSCRLGGCWLYLDVLARWFRHHLRRFETDTIKPPSCKERLMSRRKVCALHHQETMEISTHNPYRQPTVNLPNR